MTDARSSESNNNNKSRRGEEEAAAADVHLSGADRDALLWIGRFRFVDAAVLALHLGVTRRRANARLRRLESDGLVVRQSHARTETYTVALTRRGCQLVGLPRRRPARSDVQREHDLAIAWYVTRLEARGRAVRTERECRTLEMATGRRYSVDIIDRAGPARRWPDLVVGNSDRLPTAIEFERTAKGAARLRRIVEGYRLAATTFAEVRFFCCDAQTARLLAAVLQEPEQPLLGFPSRLATVRLSAGAWPGMPPDAAAAIEAILRPRR